MLKPINCLFIITILLFILIPIPLEAQRLCGIEIEKTSYHAFSKNLYIRIQICRELESVSTIRLDWGDGQVDTVSLVSSYPYSVNTYLLDYYVATHYYPDSLDGYVEISVLGEEWMDGFTNVDYSLGQEVQWRDSVFVFSEETSPEVNNPTNIGPWTEYLSLFNYQGGVFSEDMRMTQNPGDYDLLLFTLDAIPTEGYSIAASPEELYIQNGILYWDQPIEEGQYLIATKIREYAWTDNPIYDEAHTLVSTITEVFTIFVDSANLVTTLPELEIKQLVSIFPNPTTDFLNIECTGCKSNNYDVRIVSADGKVVYQKHHLGDIRSLEIRTSDWPPGLYVVELISDTGLFIQKKVMIAY